MKRISLFIFSILSTLILFAQEASEQMSNEPEPYVNRDDWTSETKLYLLISFAILTIWLTARAFRDKPEA